jgi:CubicO group peptidase (beta-lactamase class C family)
LIKKYNWNWPDIGAVLGVLTLTILLLIQLIFFKERKITSIVGFSFIGLYLLILQFVYINWPQGLNGHLSLRASYEPYQWTTAGPEYFGVSSGDIRHELEILNQSEFIRSFLLVKDGKLIVEKYFHGADSKSAFNIKSATKSIISSLIGILIESGQMDSVNQKMIDFFPDYKDQIQDERKLNITIKDLLTMQAGLDIKPGFFGKRTIKETVIESRFNPEKFKHFEYNEISPKILSYIISSVTEKPAIVFAKNELFEPLNIHARLWIKNSDGINSGGDGLFLTARDMARFGYLYLENGFIDGNQIISENWVKESKQSYDSAYAKYSCNEQIGYGYLWRISKQMGYSCYSASGYGGQAIVIIPDLDIVMTFTHFWRNGFEWRKNEMEGEAFCKIIELFSKRKGDNN